MFLSFYTKTTQVILFIQYFLRWSNKNDVSVIVCEKSKFVYNDISHIWGIALVNPGKNKFQNPENWLDKEKMTKKIRCSLKQRSLLLACDVLKSLKIPLIVELKSQCSFFQLLTFGQILNVTKYFIDKDTKIPIEAFTDRCLDVIDKKELD